MRTALLTRNLIKGIAVITAVAFLGNQLAWAGDLITPITGAPTDGQPPGSSLADFEAGQAAKVSLIGRKQIIEDFEAKEAKKTPLPLPAGPPGPYSHIVLSIDLKSRLFEIREYYKTDSHFLEKRKRNIADSEGFTAYEYKDEDWNNTGLGRVTAASRKTANDNGIVVYEYEYHPGADDISRKVGYSDPERQIAVTAFEYDTEGAITVVEDYYASGRLHTKVDSDRAIYEYLDENSDGNNRARLIKETRPDSSYKVYEDYYEGSDQAEQIKDHDSEGVLLLSKEFDITGQLVEMSIFDNRTRVIRKIHNNKTYTEFYFDDIGELVNYFEYDSCGGITIFDAAGILIYEFNPSEIDAASIEGDSLVSVTNAAGDVIKYQDGKIFSITFRENNATLARIELDNNDALKNAILRYDDGSLGVIYEGKTIQTMFTNGTLVRYRENYKTTEYSPGNSITNFYYCADNDGNLAGIRTDNEQATSLYDANGVPLRFEKINGEISEYNNGYLSRIKTGSGEYFYEFIESTSPTVRFVGTCSEKSIPAVVQYDEDGGINTITDIDGNTMAYIDGLIESITNDSETTTYDYAFTGFNEVETLSVDRSGIERLYDSLGNLQSVTLDKTTSIVYENGSLKYLEKSDGTTIEDLTFTDNGDINDALISCPDGSVAVYSDGELLEIISASGDRIYFSSGNIETITLNNGQSYNWSYDNALIKIYDQTLNEYRWYAEGVLQKIEEGANTQLVTEYVYDDSNKLISSIISRDSQILYTYSYTYENDLTLIHDEDGNIQAYGPDKKLVHLTDSKGCKFTYTYVNNDNEYIKVAMPDLTFVEYDMNGNIIEIVRPDGFTIKDVILNEDDVIKGYTYVYEMIQHVIWEDKISQVITEDGSIKNYDVNGFMTSLIPVEDKIKTFRYLIDDCASVRSEEAILNHTLTNLAIEGASIHLETPFDYGSGNDGVLIVNAGEIIHIDGIKEYDSVYVAEDGILVLDEWNGTTGGQAILRSKGSVMIEGTIDASAKGFRGGINNPSTNRAYGENPAGGSYNGIGLETRDNNYGGGGGGKDGYNQQPDAPGGSGGGGGGYGTDGGCGCNETYRGYDGHGYAGEAYGDEPLTDFYMGSGGGAGGDHSLMGNNGGNGGTGGGALKIVAPEITISGMICANGSAGKDGGDGAAGGGGGSGGTIWLSGEHINVSDGSLQVNGGVRGGGSGAGGPGGAGGLGRMRLDYAEFTGTLPEIPTLYTNQIESITGGELASAIIETSAVRYDTIIWTENSAPGTDILFYTRTGDTSIPDETWSEWSESVTDPSGSKIMSPAGKYIQYKASFQANNSLITPSIDFGYNRGISFSYQRGQNDPDDSEKVNTIIITENDQTSIYNSDGMNINDPNDFIDTSSLFFDSSDIVNLLNSRLPLYLLNETQRVLYLTDDIVISELSEITSVENNVTQYMQGVISKIKFENGSTISDIKFSKNCLPTNYLYVNSSVNKEYVVENSKIAKITDPSDTELIFNDAGFVSSIISTDNEVTTYEYLINDSKAAESMDDFSYNANEILYDQISAQIDLEFDYGDGSGGELIVPPGQTVYVDDTEEYESIYVAAGGTLAVNSWNGVSGGSTELKVKGTVFIDGVITAAGSGYRGGINDPANNRNNGPNPSGESYEGGFTIGPAPNYGGGGGGTDGDNSQPDASNGGGGAGGGYGTPGTNGSPESYNNEQLQGYGGDAYCEFRIDTLSLGSGGGAGGDHPLVGTPGGNGGGGGGAIKIFAPEIVINGQITADGEAGQDGGGNGAAGGGGGSGGTIWLAAETINITSGTISVNGGEGGNSSGAGGPGGAGGLGRIRLDYISFIGELPYTATLYANPQPGIVSKEIVSEAILTGALEYDTISWAENLPAGTDITFLTRTGGVPAPDSTWSDWSSALTNPAGSDITSPSANYIQYKAVLTTTNPDASPVLYLNDTQNIHITYTRAPKTCGDIRNLSLITASHNGSTTIYNADGVCTTDPGNVIGIADISFDVEEMADIADRIAPHLLNSSQKIITVYDKTTDAVLKTISAGHTITNFENGYVTNVKDKTGSVLVEYMYDENYMIIKTNFVNARAKLEEGYQNTLADLAMQKDEALEQLEQSRLNAVKNIELEVTRIQQQIDAERERILIAKSRYDSSIFDLSEFDKVLREIDQYEIDLHLQQIEAYTNLNEQIAQAEIDIELDAAQAMQSLLADDYNTVLGDIVWKESSPVIYAYYRSVLGRDPGLPELEYWLNFAKDNLTAITSEELISHIQNLAEYTERETSKTTIINDVTTFFNGYLSANEAERQNMLASFGLAPDEIEDVEILEEKLQSIYTWLNGQSLHFGDSAFRTIMYLLAKEGTDKTFDEIGMDCIKIDILSGVITANTTGDLVISMYAMRKIAAFCGLPLYSEKIDFDELKLQLAVTNSIILHVNGDHYVVLREIDEEKGTVTYKDLSIGSAGEDITLSRSEFMEEWSGYVLSKKEIINASNENCRYLNIIQEKNIRGSGWWQDFWKGICGFFQKVIAPIAAVLLFIPPLAAIGAIALGINIMIQTVSFVVRTGTLMDIVWAVGTTICAGVLGTIMQVVAPILTTIGTSVQSAVQTIMPGLKGVFNVAVPLFDSIASTVTNISTGIGNIFTPILGEAIAESLVSTVIRQAINMGTSYLFNCVGIDPGLSRIGAALSTGYFTGGFGLNSPGSLDYIFGALKYGTIEGINQLGDMIGLDTDLTRLAAMSAGALVGGIFEINGITYTAEQLLSGIAFDVASELAYIGVQDIAETMGLDPRISYLAGIGIRSSLQAGLSGIGGGGSPNDWIDGALNGLTRGITSVGLQWGAQELGISPLIASLITTAGVGALEGVLEGRNPLIGIYDAYFKAGTGLLTLGGTGATPWEQAAYIAQVLDFSEIIKEKGIVEALETYATGFLHQTTIDSIWKLGGVYDLLMNQDQIEFVIQPDGTEAKRIYTNEDKTDYIELALDDDRLIGKREGNIVMHCEFVKGPDGQFKLKNGDIDVYSDDGTKIIRQEAIRDFKLVRVFRYGDNGQLMDKIYQVDDESIQIDSTGRVTHGRRFNLMDDVTTDYVNGDVKRLEIKRNYIPTDSERQEYLNLGYTDEEINSFKLTHIYDSYETAHVVESIISDDSGNIIPTTVDSNRVQSIWENAVKIVSNGISETHITLDSDKGVANIDMSLTYPEMPDVEVEQDILMQAYDLARYIVGNHADWHMAITDAIPEVGSMIANNDAQFVYIAGINDTGKDVTELEYMKTSLNTDKTVVVGHSAGTETAIRSAFAAEAEKYIIASPRMKPETFCAIMQEAGVSPNQVIIVSTKGDFWNWGGSYLDYAPNSWTSVYIESGPGVDILNPKSSHSVPIDGWLSGDEYSIRIDGGELVEGQKLSDVYSGEVNK